jgi:hypothetical protein
MLVTRQEIAAAATPLCQVATALSRAADAMQRGEPPQIDPINSPTWSTSAWPPCKCPPPCKNAAQNSVPSLITWSGVMPQWSLTSARHLT